MAAKTSIVAGLLLAALLAYRTDALEFEMQTQQKCIYEEINSNVIVVLDFKAFNKDHPDHPETVDVRVRAQSVCTS